MKNKHLYTTEIHHSCRYFGARGIFFVQANAAKSFTCTHTDSHKEKAAI